MKRKAGMRKADSLAEKPAVAAAGADTPRSTFRAEREARAASATNAASSTNLAASSSDPRVSSSDPRASTTAETAKLAEAFLVAVERYGRLFTTLLRFDPTLLDHCQVGHLSAEPAHARLCAAIGKRPLLDLGMRLGEASGAALAVALVRAAVDCHADMASFASAGVSGPA